MGLTIERCSIFLLPRPQRGEREALYSECKLLPKGRFGDLKFLQLVNLCRLEFSDSKLGLESERMRLDSLGNSISSSPNSDYSHPFYEYVNQ